MSIVDLIERVETASDEGSTSVGQILAVLGQGSFSPNLLIPALGVASPLSGVPLFSSFCGIIIALVSLQMLSGRDHIWLPEAVKARRVRTARLVQVAEMLKRPARLLDRMTRQRLTFMFRFPFHLLSLLICMICGLLMPFMELVPFTSSIAGGIVALFAFGMLARDGVFTLLGFLVLPGLFAAIAGLLA
ncbi:exopolysaccharide biosynthesis protein [Paracoccus salsus]|uniref:exopolysaccharide biosynthesis protein n=1 Tax=Paracoccus salsus TaxID=2911061 RepID=UPI001F3C0393